MKIIYVLLAVLFLLSACVNVKAPADPLASNNQVPDNKPDTQNTDTTLKQCKETINYQVLVDALPTKVSGFAGDTPEGNMLTYGDPTSENVMKYSTASVNLRKDDKNIDITVTDTCYIQYLSMAWAGMYEMEGTSGYLKRATVNGYPGWHQYDKSSQSYSYTIFVEQRVIVSVNGGDDVPDADVEAAANAINLNAIKLAAK